MKNTQNTLNSSNAEDSETLRENVLHFFLDLFTVQLGLSDDESVKKQIICLDSGTSGTDHAYELRVRGQKYKSRRMSLGPLGEDSGSKSTCFKVIYDDLLVVKIPPLSIRNFSDYLENINAERRIADRLSPVIECIAPSVTAILRKIPRFATSSDIPADRLEKACISTLNKTPWFQDYLKIGGNFAFFMNLSRNSFLGHVIEKMHNIKIKICGDIYSQFDILWNMTAFEGLFGSEHASVFFHINEIYNDYEERVNLLMKRSGINASAFLYQKKEWFLLWLAEKESSPAALGMNGEFVRSLNALFSELLEVNQQEIANYRKMMRNYVSEKTFEQNRPLLKGIIMGILSLLCRLQQKGVAIRDLKPDNIFVVDNSHLRHSGEIPLGLIDFETAVYFRAQSPEQPFRGGTPSLATPSHLVGNDILLQTLENLPHIFQMQDWYAAVAMIYYAVTGEILFSGTRIRISETGRIMQQAAEKNESAKEAFRRCSRLFWYSALNEFRKKMAAGSAFFSSLDLLLPEDILEMLIRELLREQQVIREKIQVHINVQPFFRSGKGRNDLARSDYETISRCRKNWESGVNVPEARPEIRSDIIRFFQNLEELKAAYNKHKMMISSFRRSPAISVYDLLDTMFHIVFHCMYREEWGDISDEGRLRDEILTVRGKRGEKADHSVEDTDRSYEETISYEGTVTPEETVSYEKTISYDDRKLQEKTL